MDIHEQDMQTVRAALHPFEEAKLTGIENWGVEVAAFADLASGKPMFFLRGLYHGESVRTQSRAEITGDMVNELGSLAAAVKNRIDRAQREAAEQANSLPKLD